MPGGASGTCKCIVLKADGWELKLIGGPVTIIGMFEAIDTIVLGIDSDDMVRCGVSFLFWRNCLKSLSQDEAEYNKLPKNKHSLPPPLDDEELTGDVVLFRNDDNAEPVDLSLAEWKDFCENPNAEKYLKAIEVRRQREAEMDDEELEEDYDEEEEEEGDEEGEGEDEEDDDEEEEEEEPSPKKKASAPPAGEKGAKKSKA